MTTEARTNGERIEALLNERGMTITDLAELAKVDRSALTNIVNDQRGIGKTVGGRIAKALGVPLDRVWRPEEDAAARRGLAHRLAEAESLLERVLAALDREGIALPAAPQARKSAPTAQRSQRQKATGTDG